MARAARPAEEGRCTGGPTKAPPPPGSLLGFADLPSPLQSQLSSRPALAWAGTFCTGSLLRTYNL